MSDWEFKPARDLGETPGQRLQSVNREPTLVEFILGGIWQSLVKTYLKLFHRFSIIGMEHIPTKLPIVFISNHSSHLDALCIAAIIPASIRSKVYPIAATDTFFTSASKAFFTASTVNALPLTRQNSETALNQVSQLRQRLSEGDCGFILFPEGTRTRTGALGSFKRGVGKLVAGLEAAVVPCYIAGAFDAFGPTAKFPRPRPVNIYIGTPLSFNDRADNEEGWSDVAAALEEAIRKLIVTNSRNSA